MFGRRFKLIRVFGLDIKADLTWFILALLIVTSLAAGTFPRYYPELSTTAYVGMAFVGAIGLFISIVLHEIGHSLVGRYYGIPVREITLFVFGGVAKLEREPTNPKSEFLMAIAGPLVSIVLGFTFGGAYFLSAESGANIYVRGITLYLSQINFMLAAFNMIPAFPLDGGRVLRSVLWGIKKDLRWATRVASIGGSIFGYFLIFSGLLQFLLYRQFIGLWPVSIGSLLVIIAKASYNQLIMKQALQGRTIRSFMNPNPITCEPNAPLERIMSYFFYDSDLMIIPVIEHGRIIGCISAQDLAHVPESEWSRAQARNYLSPCPDGILIESTMPAEDAVKRMLKSGRLWLYVMEKGRFVGTVSWGAITRYVSITGVPA